MTMAILASVGSAIGSAIGTAAGAIGAVGGAVSAGAGSVASGLGLTSLGSALGGATAGGTAVGAGTSALSGLGLGSLGGTVASAAPSAALSGAASATGAGGSIAGFSPGALAGAVPASSGTGIAGGVVTAPTAGGGMASAALPTTGSVFMGATPSLASQAGSFLGKEALKEGASEVLSEKPQMAPRSGGGGRPKSRYDTEEQEQGMGNPFANPFAGFAEGGLTTLKGGGISMREGQYVVPADVVSAIGNGSSKAGAKFLEQAFNHYIQNGPPEGVKPQQRAGSLAEQRMMERLQRKTA